MSQLSHSIVKGRRSEEITNYEGVFVEPKVERTENPVGSFCYCYFLAAKTSSAIVHHATRLVLLSTSTDQ